MAHDDAALMAGDGSDVVGITQRELLLEMRADLKVLNATVEAIAKDQALGVERRANMRTAADAIVARLDSHDREIDAIQKWQNRADGAMTLARWALGASMVSLVAVAIQLIAALARPQVIGS